MKIARFHDIYYGVRVYIPCTTREWDNLCEYTREIINFGDGFELAGLVGDVNKMRKINNENIKEKV